MAKLFIGYAQALQIASVELTDGRSGLAWHTTDQTLFEGFEKFGKVEEAVLESSHVL